MQTAADWLFKLAFVSYAGALGNYVGQLAIRRDWVKRAATVLATFGVALHSAYLVVRWATAGQVEVAARDATGDAPVGLERFWTYIMHPPYTNLYDALVFVAWAVMVVYLIVEARWKLRAVGAIAVAMVIIALGEASLVTENEIKPLVPALQSYWILIHVAILFISYSLFSVASICALMFLIKAKARLSTMGAVQLFGASIVTALVGGSALFSRAAFELSPSAMHAGKISAVHWFPPGSDKAAKWFAEVPAAGPLTLIGLVLMIAAAVLYTRQSRAETRGAPANDRWAYSLALAGFASLTAALGIALGFIVSGATVALPPEVQKVVGESTAHWGLASNYSLGLLALVWCSTGGFLLLARHRDALAEMLPEAKKLDDITYRVITIGFPLLSFGVVMGAMWAYDAWGRYWGWDPKETWALITWTVYAIYLHTRITYGWSGKRAAAIATFGFAVVVFTFMGVNLGLTGEGLHTYGSG